MKPRQLDRPGPVTGPDTGRMAGLTTGTWVALTLLAAVHGPVAAQGFQCAPVLPSSSGAPAYGPVAPQRCEGFFDRTVSQPFIELVSLTRGVMGPGAADGPLQIHGTKARSSRSSTSACSPRPTTTPSPPTSSRKTPACAA